MNMEINKNEQEFTSNYLGRNYNKIPVSKSKKTRKIITQKLNELIQMRK